MRRLVITLFALAAVAATASAEPANYASRRYSTDFQGEVLKATQFIEYKGDDLSTCNSLLTLADGLNPKERTVLRSCSVARAAPDGSPPQSNPSPDDFYISYEDPALRARTPRTFTVYHISQNRMTPSVCQQLIASFHGHQLNAKCHAPKSKLSKAQMRSD